MPYRSTLTFSPPGLRLIRWLASPACDVPEAIRTRMLASLFEGVPIFLGGVVNTLFIALVCAWRVGSTTFIVWCGVEAALAIGRTALLLRSRRAARARRETATDLHFILGLCWAASVGYGAFLGFVANDWVVATLTCLSAAGMVGGICFRNYAAPRYVAAMIVLSLGPCVPGALMSGQPVLLAVVLQVPLYVFAMTAAAFRLSALLVDTMRASSENARRALRDNLTGLFNRDGLEESFAQIAERPETREGTLCVLYLDLDLFKEVNDRHGHAAGDHVLKAVADRLRRVLRQTDHAARIGGDEFVVLVQGIDAAQARRIAHRLVQEITEPPFRLPDGDTVRLGVSIGMAISRDPAQKATLSALLASADQALYEAKANGRSQYRIATAEAVAA